MGPCISYFATPNERPSVQSKATTEALRHACTAIQSAHLHYSTAMDLLEAVCSPKKTRWEAMMGDEQSRQETYRGEHFEAFSGERAEPIR